jgi:LPXTG-site transpeptidase (sortase) family protein
MEPRPTKRGKGWILTALGACLFIAAAFYTSYAVAHQLHQDHAAQVLIQSEREAISKQSTAAQKAGIKTIAGRSHGAACQIAGVKPGQLSGILSIPAIKLQAPVEQGTDDAELNVAIGHNPSSVWPGLNGASVFLAHDVSYFVHLNSLKPGDIVTYETACSTVQYRVSGSQIVPAGSPVYDTPTTPTIVLDTCWPPNALFFTSQRYLVRASEVTGAVMGSSLSKGKQLVTSSASYAYRSAAPPDLVAQGLQLDHGNYAPMGTMGLVNASVAFSQSPGPLTLEGAALNTYFGGWHAGSQKQATWWSALAPGVAMPPQLAGASQNPHYNSSLNVEIDSDRSGNPTQVVLHTTVSVAGGAAPGNYTETVVLPVHNGVVTIGSWQFT